MSLSRRRGSVGGGGRSIQSNFKRHVLLALLVFIALLFLHSHPHHYLMRARNFIESSNSSLIPTSSEIWDRHKKQKKHKKPLSRVALRMEVARFDREESVRNESRFIFERAFLDYRDEFGKLQFLGMQFCHNKVPLYAWFYLSVNTKPQSQTNITIASPERELVNDNESSSNIKKLMPEALTENWLALTPVVVDVKKMAVNSQCPRGNWNKACWLSPFHYKALLPKEIRNEGNSSEFRVDKVVITSSDSRKPTYKNDILKHGQTLNDAVIDTGKQVILKELLTLEHNPTKFRYKLAVCIPPLYLFADWVQIVQFLEIWRHLGAELFVFYESSVTKDVESWLRAYEAEGIVRRRSWPLLPRFTEYDPNLHLYRLGYNLATLDCVHSFSGEAEYLALLDVDEFMLKPNSAEPTKNSLITVLNELDKNTRAGAFMVKHQMLRYSDFPPAILDPTTYGFEHLNKVSRCVPGRGPTKILVRPHRTIHTTIHKVRKVLPDSKIFTTPFLTLYHLRRYVKRTRSKDKIKKFGQFGTLQPIVVAGFRKMVSKYFPREIELKSMKSGQRTLESMHECMKSSQAMFQSRSTSPLCNKVPQEFCKDKLHSKRTEWVFRNRTNTPIGFSVLF